MKRLLPKLGISLLVTAIAIAAAELAMAKWNPQSGAPGETNLSHWGKQVHQPSEVPGLYYELRPGARKNHRPRRQDGIQIPIEINRYGMRGSDFEFEKGDARRIVVLGDSTTFGYGVGNDEPYAAVLETMLNNRGKPRRYQTLNFGVAGYSTKEEALVFEHKALAFEPDAVVIGYNLNDPDGEHVREPLYNTFAPSKWWHQFH